MFYNNIRAVGLFVILIVIISAVGFLLGGFWGLVIALALSVLLSLSIYFYSDRIVLNMYDAKKASIQEYNNLHEITRDIAMNAGIQKPDIYVIDSEHPNALSTGKNHKKSSIAVTTGALKLLEEEELRGLIGHEMGHIRSNDILPYSVGGVLAGVIATPIYTDKKFLRVLGSLFLTPIVTGIVRISVSNKNEFRADEISAKLLKNPMPLANALTKINSYAKEKPIDRGNGGMAHMFSINPFSSRRRIENLKTHPSVSERISRLKSMNF